MSQSEHTGASLQERFAPTNRCFGCGPANEQGLRIRSFPEGDGLVALWQPQRHHEAFDNMLNGGIIGALLDCHCNWMAAYHLMQSGGLKTPPCTVTAEYRITLAAPTPTREPVRLWSEVVSAGTRSVEVLGRLSSAGSVTATCEGHFVQVLPGHPAYHRW